MAKKRGPKRKRNRLKRGQKGYLGRRSGPVYNAKKAGKSGHVPLPILQKRLIKLSRIINSRT